MMKKTLLLIAACIAGSAAMAQSKKAGMTYGNNIVRLYPINVFEFGGVGLGLGYERILTDDGKLGVKLPFHLGLRSQWDNFSGPNGSNTTNYALMFNPGIKFYPSGQRKVTYGLGFSIFGITASNDRYEGNWNGTSRFVSGSSAHLGMMVDNSLQFNLSPKFNIGMEVGLGPSYLNRYTEGALSWSDPLRFMGSFNFHMGYRF